jgi:hypothetical protein
MAFDPQMYMQATQKGANATEFKPLPVGVYSAVIMEPEIKTWQGKKDPTMSGIKFCFWADVQTPVEGFPKPRVKCEIMLDTDREGVLLMGESENIRLGKLRKSVGLNDPNTPWTFQMFEGRAMKVSVKHRADPTDASKIYAEADGFFPPN